MAPKRSQMNVSDLPVFLRVTCGAARRQARKLGLTLTEVLAA